MPKIPFDNKNIGGIGNAALEESLPCIAFLDKKPFKVFKSRRECADYFGKRHSCQIGATIARKGSVIFEGKKYPIRNYNPNKDKTE